MTQYRGATYGQNIIMYIDDNARVIAFSSRDNGITRTLTIDAEYIQTSVQDKLEKAMTPAVKIMRLSHALFLTRLPR